MSPGETQGEWKRKDAHAAKIHDMPLLVYYFDILSQDEEIVSETGLIFYSLCFGTVRRGISTTQEHIRCTKNASSSSFLMPAYETCHHPMFIVLPAPCRL